VSTEEAALQVSDSEVPSTPSDEEEEFRMVVNLLQDHAQISASFGIGWLAKNRESNEGSEECFKRCITSSLLRMFGYD
jgi:hypothetical protein